MTKWTKVYGPDPFTRQQAILKDKINRLESEVTRLKLKVGESLTMENLMFGNLGRENYEMHPTTDGTTRIERP